MITIDLQIDLPYQDMVQPNRLDAVLQTTLQLETAITAELTVVITSDEAVHELNRHYLGHDMPTDVLSFAASNPADDFIHPPELTTYLGDVIIAAPTAQRQAAAAGHTTAEEILLLAIHGTLHLLGFDHTTYAGKEAMWQRQREILTRHNLAHVIPTE